MRINDSWMSGLAGCVFLINASMGSAQIIQLPTQHVFSLDTTVYIPDQGSASLGGISRSATGSRSRRGMPGSSFGGVHSTSNASVSAQIIDLAALDEAIRYQARPVPIGGMNRNQVASGTASDSQRPSMPLEPPRKERRPASSPGYDYIAAGTHGPPVLPTSKTPIQDAIFYLEKAKLARSKGQWAAVEVFYKLAWQTLPEKDRQQAMARLLDDKNRVASKDDQAASTKSAPLQK